MTARNGASWSSKLEPKATMIRIAVATPTNRNVTVPRATAMARREESYDRPTWNPSTAAKNNSSAIPRPRHSPPSRPVMPAATSAPHRTSGRRTISRATVSTPNSFPQTNSAGSKSLTRRRSSDPRSRSVVTLVTASAVTATRLASTIGTTASATASRSGLGLPASPRMPATATANSSSHAMRTTMIILP